MNRLKSVLRIWLPCLLTACMAACADSDESAPSGDVALVLETPALDLGSGETGAVRFTVSPWRSSWKVGEIALAAADGGTPHAGCAVTGRGNFGGGRFAAYLTDDGTGSQYDGDVRLQVAIGGRTLVSEPFPLRSTAEGSAPLPVVRITTVAPVEDKNTWIDGTIQIEGNGLDDLPLMTTQVKGRGNSTWKWDKKPYALKLSKKRPVLGMPEHKRWCLIANYMDKTLMRNRVAYYIAAHTGLGWTPRTRFADVWFNGEYLGNYLVVEQIKIDENRLAIDEMTPEDDAGDALTGGYLIELDSYFDETNKFRSMWSDMPVNIKSPEEEITFRQFDYIRNYFNEADALLFDKEFRDFSSRFDIDSFLDLWIVNELMGNNEIKHPKSFYIHKPRGGKLTAGPVWDFDYGTLTLAYAGQWMVRGENAWLTRMLSSRNVRRRAQTRWRALYPFLKTVPDYIERQRTYIAESAAQNFERWPEIETEHPNGDEKLSFDEAVTRLKISYEARLDWLNGQVESW